MLWKLYTGCSMLEQYVHSVTIANIGPAVFEYYSVASWYSPWQDDRAIFRKDRINLNLKEEITD